MNMTTALRPARTAVTATLLAAVAGVCFAAQAGAHTEGHVTAQVQIAKKELAPSKKEFAPSKKELTRSKKELAPSKKELAPTRLAG
jgi:Skp family chaperone for outer membrane proteins